MRRVVFDTETTGLSKTDQVIEFAATELLDRKIGASFSFRCKPTVRIDPGAQEVHGISLADLELEPSFAEQVNDLLGFLQGAEEVVAHNAKFDVDMLNAEFARAGIAPSFGSRFKVVDTLVMARQTLHMRRNRLGDVAEHFNIEYDPKRAHSAVYDTQVLANVYLALTAGQSKMELTHASLDRPMALPGPSHIKRLVFFPSQDELKAHAEFCAANNIVVF